jgi:hypothetical protein
VLQLNRFLPSSALGVCLISVAAGCARAQSAAPRRTPAPATGEAQKAEPARPLASLATMHAMVLPTQYLRANDSLGWTASIASPRTYLSSLDAEIEFAIKDRSIPAAWVYPSAVERSARMNPTAGTDPHALASGELIAGVKRKGPELGTELARQLRALVALNDGRFVVVPAELRFEVVPPAVGADSFAPNARKGRAVLHVVMVDARASQIVWSGDVPSDPATKVSPAMAAAIASRLADLVAAPPK